MKYLWKFLHIFICKYPKWSNPSEATSGSLGTKGDCVLIQKRSCEICNKFEWRHV